MGLNRKQLTAARRSEIFLTNIDTGDCGIIALQALTGVSRDRAERLAEEHGYKQDSGSPHPMLPDILGKLGYTVTSVETDRSETPATFACRMDWGRYLVYIESHVMALVDGDLYNSRGFWHNRVYEVLKVEGGAE